MVKPKYWPFSDCASFGSRDCMDQFSNQLSTAMEDDLALLALVHGAAFY